MQGKLSFKGVFLEAFKQKMLYAPRFLVLLRSIAQKDKA
jgi:hypothetical protein